MKIYKELEQQTPKWYAVREWTLTWTKMSGAVGGDKAQLTQTYTLLAEKYVNDEDLKAWEIIERGNELEDVAKLNYEELTGRKVEEVGFITKTGNDNHGLSPDWIILDEDCGLYTGAVEIKCPMWKNYVKYLLEDKIPDEYKWQVTNYFIVMEDLQWLDFAVFNPDVSPEIPSFHIIRVTREDMQKDIDKAEKKLKGFISNWEELEDKLLIKDAELCE